MWAYEQAQLSLSRAPQSAHVPVEMVWSKRTQGSAFTEKKLAWAMELLQGRAK